MTSFIIFALGIFGAGFIVGALLVHWSYRVVRFGETPYENNFTRAQGGNPEYNVGDVVLVKDPRLKAEKLTITHITESYDGNGHYLMSGKRFIPVDHIIGRCRP